MKDKLIKIGHDLRSCREAKGIELIALANKTRISISFLENIESGKIDFLSMPYVRAFLRTFAHEVGLDPDVVVAQLDEALSDDKKLEKDITVESVLTEAELLKPHEDSIEKPKLQTRWDFSRFLESRNALVVGTVIILFVIVAFAALHIGKKTDEQAGFPIQEIPLEAGLQDSDSTSAIVEPEIESLPQELTLRLTISASETTWMRIVIDEDIADECIFTPGDIRSWEGTNKFALHLGNAGGVNLSLNGRPLGTPGVSGRVTHVIVTEDGMQQQASTGIIDNRD